MPEPGEKRGRPAARNQRIPPSTSRRSRPIPGQSRLHCVANQVQGARGGFRRRRLNIHENFNPPNHPFVFLCSIQRAYPLRLRGPGTPICLQTAPPQQRFYTGMDCSIRCVRIPHRGKACRMNPFLRQCWLPSQ